MLFVSFVVSLAAAEPCVFPLKHWVQYGYDASKPDDIMSTYMRVDSAVKITDTYYEYSGQMINMTVRGSFKFLHENWTKASDPNGMATNYLHFCTYSKNYRGGLPSVPLTKPAEPNVVEPTPYRISATTKEGGVYHLPTCRYVTDTAKAITIKQAELYRPCSVCKPNDPVELLKSILPAEIVGELWMNQE